LRLMAGRSSGKPRMRRLQKCIYRSEIVVTPSETSQPSLFAGFNSLLRELEKGDVRAFYVDGATPDTNSAEGLTVSG
jgi:hypothetical protein